MPRKLHLTNVAGRDATIQMDNLRPGRSPSPAVAGERVSFRRYVASTEDGLHEAMVARFGDDYADQLVDGDPEIDLEIVGRQIGKTDQVFLSASGEVLYNEPQVVEVIIDTDGDEVERRSPEDLPANVNDEMPVRWTGRKMPIGIAARKFAFKRTIQLRHVDGLTYDFLFAMAQELHDDKAVVLMRAGSDGKQPLVFQMNGTPYQGFLEGRVDGDRYQLLLHLSNLELKRPEAS